jgi:hypothetical protein
LKVRIRVTHSCVDVLSERCGVCVCFGCGIGLICHSWRFRSWRSCPATKTYTASRVSKFANPRFIQHVCPYSFRYRVIFQIACYKPHLT